MHRVGRQRAPLRVGVPDQRGDVLFEQIALLHQVPGRRGDAVEILLLALVPLFDRGARVLRSRSSRVRGSRMYDPCMLDSNRGGPAF